MERTDLETLVLDLLKKHSLSLKVLEEFFSVNDNVKEVVSNLISKGELIQKRNQLYLPSHLHLIKARIVAIKERVSFASVSEDEEDILIYNENLNGAFLDDEVYLRRTNSFKEEYEVFSIIKRSKDQLVGQTYNYKNQTRVRINNVTSDDVIFILEGEYLMDGYIVRTYLDKTEGNRNYLKLISIEGHIENPYMDIKKIVLENGAEINFAEEIMKEVKSIPNKVLDSELEGRVDFTSSLVVTIDGDDSKDFDDAVSVTRDEENYLVEVHIADVSHYVKENTLLDKEAFSRGTSIYVSDKVVPMLPFELSNGICSLNPHEIRLTTSVIFKVNPYGEVIDSRITKGYIESKYRLTYSYVNKLLHKELKKEEHLSNEVDALIYLLNEVSRKIRKNRFKRGSLDIETTELKFKMNDKGEPIEVKKAKQDEGEKLIEDLMIVANEIVASTLESFDLVSLYRIHELPQLKKFLSFMTVASNLGYKVDFNVDAFKPIDIQHYLDSIEDKEDRHIISYLLLRSLAKARYSTENKGHFGLASLSYTHFTSPIRRYPDLIVHRLIDRYIIKGDYDLDNDYLENMNYIAEDTSTKERRAITIERQVDDLLSTKFMSKHIDEEFDGFVSGLTNTKAFVELDSGIEGAIDLQTTFIDYEYDESKMEVRSKSTKEVLRLGDIVRVRVISTDLEKRSISFSLLSELESYKIEKKGNHHGRYKNNHHK